MMRAGKGLLSKAKIAGKSPPASSYLDSFVDDGDDEGATSGADAAASIHAEGGVSRFNFSDR